MRRKIAEDVDTTQPINDVDTAFACDSPQVIDLSDAGDDSSAESEPLAVEPAKVESCEPISVESIDIDCLPEVRKANLIAGTSNTSESTLDRIQREQFEWSRKNFGDHPAWHPLLGLQEEIGELSHAYLKKTQNIRTDEDHDEAMKDAVADIVIYLVDFCSTIGYRLESELVSTWEKVKQRDWNADPTEGNGLETEPVEIAAESPAVPVKPQAETISTSEPNQESADMWSTLLASTPILDNIKRFGPQRKTSVVDTCPTVGDLQKQRESSGGLTAIDGVGKSIAQKIATNLDAWIETQGGPAPVVEDDPDAAIAETPQEATVTLTDALEPTASDKANSASGDATQDDSPPEPDDSGPLAGLTLLESIEGDDQAMKSRQRLTELVTKYRESGDEGYEVEPQYEQYFDGGKTDAENEIPGDDCIYIDEKMASAWAWGWICMTLGE